jgi:hypothetical protein
LLILAFNGLTFWQRHIFLYILACPLNVVYGLYLAADGTMYSTTWVIGIIICILGLFCLYRVGAKLLNHER